MWAQGSSTGSSKSSRQMEQVSSSVTLGEAAMGHCTPGDPPETTPLAQPLKLSKGWKHSCDAGPVCSRRRKLKNSEEGEREEGKEGRGGVEEGGEGGRKRRGGGGRRRGRKK